MSSVGSVATWIVGNGVVFKDGGLPVSGFAWPPSRSTAFSATASFSASRRPFGRSLATVHGPESDEAVT